MQARTAEKPSSALASCLTSMFEAQCVVLIRLSPKPFLIISISMDWLKSWACLPKPRVSTFLNKCCSFVKTLCAKTWYDRISWRRRRMIYKLTQASLLWPRQIDPLTCCMWVFHHIILVIIVWIVSSSPLTRAFPHRCRRVKAQRRCFASLSTNKPRMDVVARINKATWRMKCW